MGVYVLWSNEALSACFLVNISMFHYKFFRRRIKQSKNLTVLVENFGYFTEYERDELTKHFLMFCSCPISEIHTSKNVFEGVTKLFYQLTSIVDFPVPEPSIHFHHSVAHLCELTHLDFEYSNYVMFLVFRIYQQRTTFKTWQPTDLINLSESVTNLTKIDYEKIGLYFKKHPHFYVRLCVIVGYSIYKILQKYSMIENWIRIQNQEELEDRLKNPYCVILLNIF